MIVLPIDTAVSSVQCEAGFKADEPLDHTLLSSPDVMDEIEGG